MATLSTTYVDRDEASKILNVSTRTIDRYVRKFKLKTRKDGRRILIKRDDVDKIIQDQIGQFVDLKNKNLADARAEKLDKQNTSIAVKDLKVESSKKGEKIEKSKKNEEQVYRNLYNETKAELKEKQERLDAATYRVGQLESQVESMVPMLEYTRKEKELKEAKGAIEQKEIEKIQIVSKLENQLRSERIVKWIWMSLFSILFAMGPILIMWWLFSTPS